MGEQEHDLRRKILDRARYLLVKEGYSGLSMRKIAQAVGYSATSIYLYFKNKDELFHTLILEGLEKLYMHLSEGLEERKEPEERLRMLCERYLTFGLANPEYYEIMFMLHPEKSSRFPREHYRRGRRNLSLFIQTLEEGVRQGIFHCQDVAVSASVIWMFLHGAVSLVLAHRLDTRIDQAVCLEEAVERAVASVKLPVAITDRSFNL